MQGGERGICRIQTPSCRIGKRRMFFMVIVFVFIRVFLR